MFSKHQCSCLCHISRCLIDVVIVADDSVSFPEWLQLLITCACFVKQFHIQSAAVSTMLDLTSLTQSLMTDSPPKVVTHEESSDSDDERDKDSSASEYDEVEEEATQRQPTSGTVSVVIIPSLSTQNFDYLNSHTHFYRVRFYTVIVLCGVYQYVSACS